MGNDHWVKYSSILVILTGAMLAPDTALAGGNTYPGKNRKTPSAGYPAPIASAYPFGGAIGDPIYAGCCYTFPLQMVYQCPAVLVGQPGSRVVYLRPHPMSGLLGGQPYLYHP